MNMSDAVISRGEKVVVDFVLCVEAANVGVADQVCCVVVNVVHGGCVVCSPRVSCLVVNSADFCVSANVHSVCACANLLVFFQQEGRSGGGCGRDVGLWGRGGSVRVGGGLVDISE